jgi:hypothetical protein
MRPRPTVLHRQKARLVAGLFLLGRGRCNMAGDSKVIGSARSTARTAVAASDNVSSAGPFPLPKDLLFLLKE